MRLDMTDWVMERIDHPSKELAFCWYCIQTGEMMVGQREKWWKDKGRNDARTKGEMMEGQREKWWKDKGRNDGRTKGEMMEGQREKWWEDKGRNVLGPLRVRPVSMQLPQCGWCAAHSWLVPSPHSSCQWVNWSVWQLRTKHCCCSLSTPRLWSTHTSTFAEASRT